jgi:hypothetical protein
MPLSETRTTLRTRDARRRYAPPRIARAELTSAVMTKAGTGPEARNRVFVPGGDAGDIF